MLLVFPHHLHDFSCSSFLGQEKLRELIKSVRCQHWKSGYFREPIHPEYGNSSWFSLDLFVAGRCFHDAYHRWYRISYPHCNSFMGEENHEHVHRDLQLRLLPPWFSWEQNPTSSVKNMAVISRFTKFIPVFPSTKKWSRGDIIIGKGECTQQKTKILRTLRTSDKPYSCNDKCGKNTQYNRGEASFQCTQRYSFRKKI